MSLAAEKTAAEAPRRGYEDRQTRLGDGFPDAFETIWRRILKAPERWRSVRGESRKPDFDRFPGAVVHNLENNQIHIKTCMRLHRRPFYWSYHQ